MKRLRTALVWLALVGAFVAAFELSSARNLPREDFQAFLGHVEQGAVARVRVDGNALEVTLHDGRAYETLGVLDEPVLRALSGQGVEIAWGAAPHPWRSVLLVAGPLVLFLGLFVYFLRKQQGGVGNVLSLRKTTARLVTPEQAVRFADVGGCEEAIEQLRDVIDFLKHPERWTGSGVRLPRGVLLEGPPGCGKTLLARAVAGETDARFFLVSGSEFVEMFVGVGAARVRDTFATASRQAPAVIFIDEIDAVGRRRGSGIGAAHDEREQTLNQILVCLDGFERRDRVVVIAATNRADILDPALLRAGRFDRRIAIPPLSREQRAQVLAIHTRDKSLASDVDLEAVAERTPGWNGAQLECLANEAGLLAVRRLARGEDASAAIRNADFERALAAHRSAERRFDCVDALLVESTSQLAQPVGTARVRLTLLEGTVVEGELVWADASFLKLRSGDSGEGIVVAKRQVKSLEPLEGTALAPSEGVAPDPWTGRTPDLA